MICYNQERLISTALDSVLNEKIRPFEIIIGDDFSTDGTREVLKEYQAKHPDIVKLNLNEKNMGIFANLNNLTPQVSGDMVHFLAGDDWFKPKFIENMNKKIAELSLDPSKDKFIFLPDVIIHHPDGSEQTLKNDGSVIAQYSPVGLVIRDLACWRQVGISRALFEKWPLFPEEASDIGPWSDRIQHVKFAQYIDRQIILDCEGAVYREGVGIASRTKQAELELSYCKALRYLNSLSRDGGLILSQSDADFLDFVTKCSETKLDCTLGLIGGILLAAMKICVSDAREISAVKPHVIGVCRNLASQSFVGRLRRTIKKVLVN